MAKKIKTKSLEKRDYAGFLDKAQEFYDSMSLNFAHGKYNAAASAGIHSAILIADACLIYSRGVKCSSQRHLDVVPLIENLALHDAKNAATHLERVLDVKSYVKYTGDTYTAPEARQIITHVERFVQWARSVLPRS